MKGDQCQFCVFGPKMLDKCEYYHLPESLRVHKSADTNAKILELEQIISDLRGHMAWHKRRVARESE